MVPSTPTKAGAAGTAPAIADHARMLETLLSNLPGMVYRCRNDQDWTMMFVSEGSRELTGYSPAELSDNRRTSYAEVIVPEDRAQVWDTVQAALAKREAFELRYRITTAAGAQKWVWERGLGIFNAAGQLEHIEGFVTDITEHKLTERALRNSEEKFSKAFRVSPDAISLSDALTGQILDVNEAFVRLSGFTREQIVGRTSKELGLWDAPGARDRMMAELSAKGSIRDLQVTARTQEGKERLFLISGERVEIGGRACLVILGRDITDQKKSEQALQESEAKALKAFRATPDAVFITEVETGKIVDVNESGCRLYGYTREEFVGHTTVGIGLLQPADRERMIAALRQGNGTLRDFEMVAHSKNNGERTMLLSCETIELGGRPHMVTIAHDITDRKRVEEERGALEEQYRQAQKLEALGQLAGGIAHDFNNILTGIMAYTELTLLDADRPDEVRKHIAAVRHASQRAGDLVRQILTFSRRQAPERKPTRVSAAVREAFKLLRSTLPKTIEIVEEIDPTAPIVLADSTQIHQVVMNLCTNAAHAMRDRPGRLTVRVALFESGVSEGLAPLGVGQGRHTRLTIDDTGSGMDAATLNHIFEPFFTTKAPGEGTGLGLAVVHGIVEEHDGVITVRSQPGMGTTFDLYFPEFSALEDSTPPFEAPLPRGQGQCVLFVDDEGVIVRAVAQLLERLGYRTTVHGDPREAWAAFDAQPDAFDIVVTDLTMPHWTGLDLARRILARRADIPIVLTTGHSGSWTPEGIRAFGLRGMINKPLTSAKLANELHALLAGPAATRSRS